MSIQQCNIWNSLDDFVGQLDQNQSWHGNKPLGTDKHAVQTFVFFDM